MPRYLVSIVLLALACSSPKLGPGSVVTDGGDLTWDGSVNPSDIKGADGGDTADLADSVSDTVTLTDLPPGAVCMNGEKACINGHVPKVCITGQWKAADSCLESEACLDGTCIQLTDACTPGKTKCDGYATQVTCSADGKSWQPKKCPGKQQCADGLCRDVVCTPLINECTGANLFHTCKSDGSGFEEAVSCKSGAMCLGGKCLSLCETNIKISSNVGCEYWSVDLDSYHDPFGGGTTPDFIPNSMVVFNPGIYDANVKFTIAATCPDGSLCKANAACGPDKVCDKPAPPYALAYDDLVVKAGKSREFKMPVMNSEGNTIAPKGIHLTSDQPIIAWQFNPFNAAGAYSNDGSLLLPQNVLGKQYYVISEPSGPVLPIASGAQHGYFTVVAASPGYTAVTITPSADVAGDPFYGIPKLKKGVPWTVNLLQHQVLTVQSTEAVVFPPTMFDLTGTFVQADKAIAVFGGHEELVLGWEGNTSGDNCCAEHVEEQLMPLESWGTDALCVKTKPRGNEPDIWRVMAGDDNVTVTTNPPVAGLNGHVFAKAGDWVEVETPESFQLSATGKIQVVQFIVSGHATDDFIGDPTMMVVPAKNHYRTDYGILTAAGYKDNFGSVVRPAGTDVTLDGVSIGAGDFQAFGDGTWERAYVTFATGAHTFESKKPFGLMVYGYGNATAYGYPGGMNLK